MKYSKTEVTEARAWLLNHLKPGDTVYTVLEHVSKSGMTRDIRVLIPFTADDGRVDFWHPNHAVGAVLGLRSGRSCHDGIRVSGCGMDMGFHLIYSLGYALWPEGFGCVGQSCPSNDHSNGDRDYTPGHLHGAGGYALKHRWL